MSPTSPTSPAAAIVLLHGLGGSRISWEPQLAGLSLDHRVIAWELPGYGDAPPLAETDGRPLDLTFPLLADAVAAFVDDVVGPLGSAVHLVGISFGGMIAQYAAAAHPERFASMTLLATSPKFGLDGTEPAAWRAARLAPLDAGQEPVDFASAVLAHLAGPHISDAALDGQRAAMARVSGAALRRSIDCLVTHDSRALLPTIVVPTLCLVGELDEETPADYGRALSAGIPGASLVVVPDAGHLLNVEAPDHVNRLIAAHVEQHGGRP
jgi:3-oxoadipate enol-lactonase